MANTTPATPKTPKKPKAPKASTLDPKDYDINTDPKRWQKLTNWWIVEEIIGVLTQDTVTGKVAIPPVQNGMLFDKLVPNAQWSKAIVDLFKVKPVFAGFGSATYAHFVGDGTKIVKGSEVTVHIDRDLKPSEITGGLAIIPDTNQWFCVADPGMWGDGHYLGDVEINTPTPNDPEFTLPATGTVLTFNSDDTPIDGLDGGTFRLRVMPAPDFYITLESPNFVDKGNVRQHVITADPKMPDIRVRMTAIGLTPEEDAKLVRDVKLTVSYIKGNRTDKKEFTATVTGPDWHPDWGGKFYGGDIEVEVTATMPWGGAPVTKKLPKGTHVIYGLNPTRALIHTALNDDLYMLCIGYQESHFMQFYKGAIPPTAFQSDPATVLRAFDDGYGIGQLTYLLPAVPHLVIVKNKKRYFIPIVEQLWNWKANAAATVQMAQIYRAKAVKAVAMAKQVFPKVKVPDLTADQLDEIGWQFYNAGMGTPTEPDPTKGEYTYPHQYWKYEPKSNTWTKHPIGNYVTKCKGWRDKVRAKTPPPGWN